MEEATLTLQESTLSDEALHELSLELCRALNQEADVRATLAEAPPLPGAKGDAFTLHNILLEIVTGGAGHFVGGAAIGVLASFFERIPDLKAVLRDKNGKEHVIDAKSVRQGRRKRSAKDARKKSG